ncbi:O-acetylserine/cysteine efflux transporter [Sphingomonas jejuensis]|uniref:O-acetylserine/cysteine efflux transporter n=1 Tax=Sphingomonas jejuensis TaxID=904715 RepID=A0ABX0XKB2_9SPHN|nr:DMT family transporter [Sphingomonas jejuensis]NJC33664.1 O-acetylserine/cysteine efflux transporter [Sphingomonas jejuensis]
MNVRASSGLGPRDFAIAAAMCVLWGFNIIAVKLAVEALSPFTAAFLRQVIVLLVCWHGLRIVPGRMGPLVLLGILSGGLFYVAINLSLAVANNVSALAIAGQLGVPFSMILAVIFLRERIHYIRIGGILLAMAGVGLLVFDPAAGRELPGIGLTAIGSFIWAICSLLQRRLVGVPVLTIYAWIGLMGSVVLLPIALLFESAALAGLGDVPLSSLGWVAFSAIGSTVLGQGAMSWLLQRHPVSSVVPLTLGAPIVSVVAASLFFGTPLTPLMILGGVIALTGVAVVTIRSARLSEARERLWKGATR